MARLMYVELPVAQTGPSAAFYTAVFGWKFTDFGPDYAATLSGDTDIGLDAHDDDRLAAPLAVIEVADLEATREAVVAAGAAISREIFAFPGGRRFHFRDFDGNELAAMQPA
ncbi:MAG: VOC family protein [Sphingomonas sp.]|jgi:hypothetical protein